MKLSKVQREILDLLNSGWELGRSMSIWSTGITIQKGGMGRGGETKKISTATWHVLWKNKLIVHTDGLFPTEKYNITKLGKKILKEANKNESRI